MYTYIHQDGLVYTTAETTFKKLSGLSIGLLLTLCNHFRILSEKEGYLPRSVSHHLHSNFNIQIESHGHAQLQGDGEVLSYHVPRRGKKKKKEYQ